ncbi:hypothetical protein C2E20_8768 [Micractinium conductrix]|uniref:BTB domain-containing protein n=1 Tax=Micractinium conductrix TaxID=554055 RepID=A0A2P6V0E1_9CHLO|nr:hypothetical protein C2E20_8768 [Micractinium conductrix]|eukprot:PSC67561.1 hypothetical protein C2E20_8768 [Micractinium conductrix]
MAEVPFDTEIDWQDPAAWYLGNPELAAMADAHIRHPSGLLLPVHRVTLSQQSRVLRGLFSSLGSAPSTPRAPSTPSTPSTPGAEPSVPSTPKAVEEVVLESPFKDFSLQEVAHLLRFLYNPEDCAPANLKAAEAQLPGVVRLAHALDAPKLLAAFSTGLGSHMQQLEGALRWLPLAEECQLHAAWGEGVRALAKIALTATSAGTLKPLEGLASSGAVVARFQRLAQLSQSTLAAVVTAVALAANCSYSHYSSPSSTRVPSARLLASLRSPGLQEASCTWTVPGFLQLLEQAPPLPPEQRKLVSPAFGSGRRTWQLCVYPHGNAAELEEAVVSVYLANSLTWGCRARLSGTATFNLLDEVGNPCISKGLHYCDSSPLTTSGAEFGSTADLRANSQRHLPGGAATFRAHVTWLEWEE